MSRARQPGEDLRDIDAAGLRRRLRVLDSPHGAMVTIDGRSLHNFASNDYLGLACHPALIDAAHAAASRYGFGSGGARLLCGTIRPHADLEDALAAFKGTAAALAFGSGFAAGSGVLPAILNRDDVVILDKLAHACWIDGARASAATLRTFAHNDTNQLDELLRKSRATSPHARIVVVTEAMFSMDGDFCPLADIIELKDRYDAVLLLDEAHATGVLGPSGRGLAAACGLSHRVDLQMGTLSKALGCHGGFLAASRDWIDLLVNRARTFIFATAPPPLVAAAATTALAIVSSADGDRLRARLESNRQRIAAALDLDRPSPSPIHPFLLGDNDRASAAAALLDESGILAPAIRYPTVPMGAARLRFSVTAAHGDEAFRALECVLPRLLTMRDG